MIHEGMLVNDFSPSFYFFNLVFIYYRKDRQSIFCRIKALLQSISKDRLHTHRIYLAEHLSSLSFFHTFVYKDACFSSFYASSGNIVKDALTLCTSIDLFLDQSENRKPSKAFCLYKFFRRCFFIGLKIICLFLVNLCVS